jgi:uncharacterized protein (DUF2147 family)
MKIMKPFILFILFVSILSLSNGYAALPDVSEMIEKTPTLNLETLPRERVELLTAATPFVAGPNDILGIWKTDMDEAKVEIFMCEEKICGKIILLKNPLYTDSREGEVGIPVIDNKNPDPALRTRPVIGLQILEGFILKGENNWGEGTFYDPKSGKTYKGKMHLAAPY